MFVQFEIASGRDHTIIITITMAAGKGGSKKRKSNNEGRYTHAHCEEDPQD